MIEPTEEQPGEFGHPVWKRNAFAGLVLCAIGVLMMVSVYLIVYGIAVLAVGIAWTVIACIVGTMQERSDLQRDRMTHA